MDEDDVYGAACLGLAQALARRNAAAEPYFDAYALRRVRGAIRDHLRDVDALSRRQRVRLRRLSRVSAALRAVQPHEPSGEEVARAAGISSEEYAALTRLADVSPEPLDDDRQYPSPSPDCEALLERRREWLAFTGARSSLPARFANIVDLYYEGDLTQRQIGQRLGVSESRVSQLRARALDELRTLVSARLLAPGVAR